MPIRNSDNFVVAIGTTDNSTIEKYINSTDISTVQQAQYVKEDIFSQDSGAVARSSSLIVSNAYSEGGTISSYATPETTMIFMRNLIGAAKASPTAQSTPTRYQYTNNFTGDFTKRNIFMYMRENDNQLRVHAGSFSEVTFDITPDQTVRIAGTWNSETIIDSSVTFTPAFVSEDIPYTLVSTVSLQALDNAGAVTGNATAIDFASCTLTISNNLTGVPTADGRTLRNAQLDASLSISKDQLNTTFQDAAFAGTAYQAVITIKGNNDSFSTIITLPVQIGEYTEDRTRGEDVAETIPFVFAPSTFSGANKISVVSTALSNNL